MTTQRSQLEATFLSRLQPTSTSHVQPPQEGELAGRRRDPSLFSLSLDRIRPDEDQVRQFRKAATDSSIQELAESIRAVGVLQPIDVRYVRDGDFYEIVAGERRYTAAKLAGLPEIPVKLLGASESDVRRLQILENIHREDLSPLELGSALMKLAETGATPDELAKLLCKTKSYIAKALSIARNLSTDAEQMIRKNPERFHSMAHLYEVSLLPHNEQRSILTRIEHENLTRAQLQAVTKEAKQRATSRSSRGGRPRHAEYSTKVIALDQATVTMRVEKAHASTDDWVALLQQALQTLR